MDMIKLSAFSPGKRIKLGQCLLEVGRGLETVCHRVGVGEVRLTDGRYFTYLDPSEAGNQMLAVRTNLAPQPEPQRRGLLAGPDGVEKSLLHQEHIYVSSVP